MRQTTGRYAILNATFVTILAAFTSDVFAEPTHESAQNAAPVAPLNQSLTNARATPTISHDERLEEFATRFREEAGRLRSIQTSVPASAVPTRTRSGSRSAPTGALRRSLAAPSALIGQGPGEPLQVQAARSLDARINEYGTVRSLRPVSGAVLQQAEPNNDGHATAMAFFKAQHAIMGLRDPISELHLLKTQSDNLGHRHLRYAQHFGGIPVFGAEVIAQLNRAGDLISISGAYIPTPTKLITRPTLSAEQARFGVLSAYPANTVVDGPRLVIYAQNRRRAHLTWHFTAEISPAESRLILVDAHDGSELLNINTVQTDRASGQGVDLFGTTRTFNMSLWQENADYFLVDTTKAMYDVTSTPPQPTTSRGVIVVGDVQNSTAANPPILFVSSPSPNGPWLADGVSAAVNLSATYDYFLDRLGRNSLDGVGGNMIGVVRVGQNLANAFFNSSTQTMYFGDAEPFAGALDVVAHEMAHGVIDTSIPGGLRYFGQSGALNESLADVFGEMAESRFNQTAPDWLIGSRLSSPLRNMMNPGALNFAPNRPYPSNMSEFVAPNDPILDSFTNRDNDGVHINSSIINRAFYLLTNGTNAITLQDAERIFYRALTTKLSTLSEFVDMRFAAVQSAEELFGANTGQVAQTKAAFDAVQIFEAPTNPAPPPVPGNAGPDGTLFVYWDAQVGDYFLGRLDPSLGDVAPGVQLSVNPVLLQQPSVSGDGTIAAFVDAQNDLCLIATNGAAAESCLGRPGETASVAVAPDGETFGFVFLDAQGSPTNVIGVVNVASNQQQLFTLVSPNIDGASNIQVLNADVLDFTSDNRFIIYDAFNSLSFDGGSTVGLWSIYAIDRSTNSTITLTTPSPGLNTGYPNVAQTSNSHIVFDVLNGPANNNTVVALNFYTGDAQQVVTTDAFFTAPVYTGDDSGIVYSIDDLNMPTLSNLNVIPLMADRISPNGPPQLWIPDAAFGAVYRRGAFDAPPEVDIGLAYTGLANANAHAARFDLLLSNNGQDPATNVEWSVSIPPNVTAMIVDDGGTPTCTVELDRIDCLTSAIAASTSVAQEFRFTLSSLSPGAELVTSATAFAEQVDSDSGDNTVIARVAEADLNTAPTLAAAITDRQLNDGVAASFSVSSNFVDSDGDSLTYTSTGLPGTLSLDSGTGVISGTPNTANVGNAFNVTVSASDQLGATASDVFNITVSAAPPPRPPAPPPPPAPTGGGGGGGGTSFLLIFLLGALEWRRRERKQR